MPKHLHIITWDVPYPANYGGVIDVFYTIQKLHDLGVQIILHCFEYGTRNRDAILEKYCIKVYYYKRNFSFLHLLKGVPYIVGSRANKQLLQNLLQDDFPILFEGVHTCYFINDASLQNRQKIVRPQNIEHHYYQQLYQNSKAGIKKIYYAIESFLLKKYENNLQASSAFVCVAQQDYLFFSKQYPHVKSYCIPSFTGFVWQDFLPNPTDAYVLYHGNLSVEENEKSAFYIISKIAKKMPSILFTIAGKNPNKKLQNDLPNNVEIIANPRDEVLQKLIENAQINLLPSFQNTGLKLKLLHALYSGKHCIANTLMLTGTGLEATCIVANSAMEMIKAIEKYCHQPFIEMDKQVRKEVLEKYDSTVNAKQLFNLIH